MLLRKYLMGEADAEDESNARDFPERETALL
jgi:hypothetical protein